MHTTVNDKHVEHLNCWVQPIECEDGDEDVMSAKPAAVATDKQDQEIDLPERGVVSSTTADSSSQYPLERLSEKRRRDEDDQDELGRLAQNGPKRRSSSAGSTASTCFRRRQNSLDRGLKSSVSNEVSDVVEI